MPVSFDASGDPELAPDDPDEDPDDDPPDDDPDAPDELLVLGALISDGLVWLSSPVSLRSPAIAAHPATARPDTKARRPHHPMLTA